MPEETKSEVGHTAAPDHCAKAALTIQHVRTQHPNLPADGLAGIWFFLTMGQCGPLPPPQ